MKKTWRGEDTFPPYDGELKLVATFDGEIKLARYNGDMWIDENTSSVVKLEGPNADIKINGASLNETLRGIQDRLNILTPNAALEEEWESLRCLGEQYRLLEKEILEKQQVWALLKKKAPKL